MMYEIKTLLLILSKMFVFDHVKAQKMNCFASDWRMSQCLSSRWCRVCNIAIFSSWLYT